MMVHLQPHTSQHDRPSLPHHHQPHQRQPLTLSPHLPTWNWCKLASSHTSSFFCYYYLHLLPFIVLLLCLSLAPHFARVFLVALTPVENSSVYTQLAEPTCSSTLKNKQARSHNMPRSWSRNLQTWEKWKRAATSVRPQTYVNYAHTYFTGGWESKARNAMCFLDR